MDSLSKQILEARKQILDNLFKISICLTSLDNLSRELMFVALKDLIYTLKKILVQDGILQLLFNLSQELELNQKATNNLTNLMGTFLEMFKQHFRI